MRVAIVENTRITHHGQMGVALHEAAAKIGQYRPFFDGALPDVAEYDALVVFGGEQNARADDTHPYLPDLARRMAAFTAADKPVMGICLGSQLLARACGADNLIGTAPEFGWCGVTLTEAGRADPVLGALPAEFPIFQWHSDTFTLPEGAVHLAQSGTARHQAFRIGRATYGTQFHFEASRAVVADWNRNFPSLVEQQHPGWLSGGHANAQATHGATADAIGLTIARGWVSLI